ncbi:MAG TPA: ROK family protein, partial [Thermoanaerobaculia bacterium]|nr:ROK family protein [Thermoanaerobaculia bacterium]
IVLIVGTGIGAGILSGGELVRGAHELSGCAGWLVVSDACNEMTAKSGALESIVAGPAIAHALGAASAIEAAERARGGERFAKDVFTHAAQHLGRAIANLISVFDPEVVVLTGGIANAADLMLDEVKRTAKKYAQPLSFPQVEIAVSKLGTEANLFGAARLALENIA